ncbi:MAG: sugar ABC transporter ATP-binding protein [Lachnospiraceae bacterium]|nr:sugar ABC transporter ATP-binding protein [Lachnospiraceae bacterium]
MSLLELENISKSFGTNKVLSGVNFRLEAGEVHALLGENGAGKSTMLNIVGGLLSANGGRILIDGQEVQINDIQSAKKYGIGFVHQEIELCQDVTVAENIMMSTISDSHALKVNFKKMAKEAGEILKPLVGDAIDPYERVANLPISQQQIVEIAKAISFKCRILLLDEPTAALSESETAALFNIMHQLKEEGIGIIFISHRMEEVFDQSDRVTVLRDGKIISTRDCKEVTMNQLIRDMAGRDIADIYPPKAKNISYTEDQVLLKVENLTDAKDRFRNINFSLYRGEILGIAGLVGAGRTEIMQSIVNLRKRGSGSVTLMGENIDRLSAGQIYDRGLVLLSEDRKKSGLFLDYVIQTNISATCLKDVTKGIFIDRKREEKLADKKIEELGVKCRGRKQVASTLSGGNQQKVLLGKLLAREPKVIILDEPTRGVDVSAKSDIGKYIRELANRGIGVIMISSEMNELLGLADRLIAIDIDGNQVLELKEELNSDQVVYYISGAYKYNGGKNA